MDTKLEMFRDQRRGKVALVAHCILNQNAKVAGLAQFPALVPGVISLLEKYEFGIQQMPCPELVTAGIRRWWQVSDQYRCAGFQREFDRLANDLLQQVEDYISHGFTVVLVGVDGSPSCGVNITDADKGGIWLGRPSIRLDNDNEWLQSGKGVFIESLETQMRLRGLPQISAIGLPLDVSGSQIDLSVLEEFLVRSN